MLSKVASRRPNIPTRTLLLVGVAAPIVVGLAVLVLSSRPVRGILPGIFSLRVQRMRVAWERFAEGRQPMATLRGAILGSGKSAIAGVLGPPRAAILKSFRGSQARFWDADTWYYPLEQTRSAMAIRFAGQVAREVQFISPSKELSR